MAVFVAVYRKPLIKKRDLDRTRETFEQLETRTAKRVLEFYDARRNSTTVARPQLSLRLSRTPHLSPR